MEGQASVFFAFVIRPRKPFLLSRTFRCLAFDRVKCDKDEGVTRLEYQLTTDDGFSHSLRAMSPPHGDYR